MSFLRRCLNDRCVNGGFATKLATDLYKIVPFIVIFATFNGYGQVAGDRHLLQVDSLKQIVRQEMVGLNLFYHRQYPISETGGQIFASPAFQIMVNFDQLQKYTSNVKHEEISIIVRLILAHEFAHLLQFENNQLAGYRERFRIRELESQADILAGRYATLLYYRSIILGIREPIWGINLQNRDLLDAYRFFFKIGTGTFAAADHPTDLQRASSIYRGVRFANLELVEERLQERRADPNTTQAYLHTLDSIVVKEKKLLNVDNTSNWFSWSLDQASLITHGDPENMAHMVRRKFSHDFDLHDRSWRHIIVVASLKNTGNVNLAMTYETRIAPKRGDTATAFFDQFNFFENKYHHILLKSKEEITVRDTFEICSCYNDFDVIFPPDVGALYNVQLVNPINSVPPNELFNGRGLVTQDTRPASIDELPNYFEQINDCIDREDIRTLVNSFATTENDLGGLDYISYLGIVPRDEKFSCKIITNANRAKKTKIILTFVHSVDSLTAVQMVHLYEKMMERYFDLEFPNQEIEYKVNEPIFFRSSKYPKNAIILRFIQNEEDLDSNTYNIELAFSKGIQ